MKIIVEQRRDQAVFEASDAALRRTSTRRQSRPVAAAEAKPQGGAAAEHDARENAKAAGVKAELTCWYDRNEFFVCGKLGHKQGDGPTKPGGHGRERHS